MVSRDEKILRSLRPLRDRRLGMSDSAPSSNTAIRCSTSRPAPVDAITPEIERLVDDMIETMYAAPGIGLAAPQVGLPLRIFVVDISLGRDPSGLMVSINPEFVVRDGMQLEEEGCLSVPDSTPRSCGRRAPSSKASTAPARSAERRHGPAGPRLSTRNGSPRRHAVRRPPPRHQARFDREAHQEAESRRQMVDRRAASHRVLRHPGVRRADARRPACAPVIRWSAS